VRFIALAWIFLSFPTNGIGWGPCGLPVISDQYLELVPPTLIVFSGCFTSHFSVCDNMLLHFPPFSSSCDICSGYIRLDSSCVLCPPFGRRFFGSPCFFLPFPIFFIFSFKPFLFRTSQYFDGSVTFAGLFCTLDYVWTFRALVFSLFTWTVPRPLRY